MARYRKANVFKNNIKKILIGVELVLVVAAVAWFFLGKNGAEVHSAGNTPSLSVEEQDTDNVPSLPKEDSDVSKGRESSEVKLERWLGIAASIIGIILGLIEIIGHITGRRSSRR